MVPPTVHPIVHFIVHSTTRPLQFIFLLSDELAQVKQLALRTASNNLELVGESEPLGSHRI